MHNIASRHGYGIGGYGGKTYVPYMRSKEKKGDKQGDCFYNIW